ncbi:hypothetical protein [Aquipuribacter sp. SD81]|uniref:hypothetical protein n=1 Tax=Aquipuribacter sp. SD81 TaxID=3127703 RepID=UPI00301673D0
MTQDHTADLTPEQAAAALAEHRRREQQTVAAGTSPWSAQHVVPVALALPVLGYLIDIDLVWLFAALVGVLAVTLVRRQVQLRTDRRSWRRDLTLLAAGVVALGADIAVQAVVRSADLPLPNTWGAAAFGVVVLVLVWPLQRRGTVTVRP